MPSTLYTNAQNRFWRMVESVRFASPSVTGERVDAATQERDVGGRDGDVRAARDGDTDVCSRERGRVVDSVADHRDDTTACAFFADDARLVLGSRLREHARDADTLRDSFRGALAVAGDHHDLDAACAERLDDTRGFGTRLVRDGHEAGEHAVHRDERRRATLVREPFRVGLERRSVDAHRCEERVRADRDARPGDLARDAAAPRAR
jgi:hypothetical protein